MKDDLYKIVISDFDLKIICITNTEIDLDWYMSFDKFEMFAKQVYAHYKKYKYIFESEVKNGIKKNTY